MSEKSITKAISIPRDLAERVADAAERERRSFSNMVAVLCEASLPSLERDAVQADAAIMAER